MTHDLLGVGLFQRVSESHPSANTSELVLTTEDDRIGNLNSLCPPVQELVDYVYMVDDGGDSGIGRCPD